MSFVDRINLTQSKIISFKSRYNKQSSFILIDSIPDDILLGLLTVRKLNERYIYIYMKTISTNIYMILKKHFDLIN